MKAKKTKDKNKGGRPKKYTLAFCLNEMKGFLEALNDDDQPKPTHGRGRWSIITWHDLLRDKKYPRQEISHWRKMYAINKEFSDTIKKIDDELENRLYKLGLRGVAHPTLVIFGLKNNYGWKDKSEVEQTINLPSLPRVVIKTRQKKNG